MTYEQALKEMKKGKTLTRPFSVWLWRYDLSTGEIIIDEPFIFRTNERIKEELITMDNEKFHDWLAATDWVIV